MKSKKIIELHPADKRDKAEEILTSIFNGESTYCPLELQINKGNRLPVETKVGMGKWNGKDCIFGISKDLSQQQEALQKFTKLFENNPALMAISNVSDDRITDVNLSFLNKLGYERNEIIGKTIDELNILPDPTTLNEVRDKIIKTGKVMELELLVKCKNGRMMTGLFSGEIIDNFGAKSFLSVMVDITEQVNLRLEVEKHRNRLNNIIEGTHLGTWEWNIKTGQTILNERWAQIAGYTLAELQPVNIETWTKLTNPDDLRKSNQLLQKHFRRETEYYEFESRIKHKNGHWVWVLDRGKVIEWDTEGNPVRMFGTHADITYQKMIEQDLRESEKRFNLALENANAGLWDWDMIHDEVYFSPLWKRMLGYDDSEVENSFNGWKNLWHPDDTSQIEEAMTDCLDGRVSSYQVIHRLRHKNGEWRWILTRGGILRDESGKPYRWIGTNMDITDEKERSNELERFFSVNLDLLCIADTEGNFIKTNRAWEEILGYSSQELENRKFIDFIHPDDLESTYQAIARLEEQKKVINFVNRYKCKDGTYRFIEWRSHPYGKLVYAAARDITNRIVYEKRIEDLSIRDPLTGIYNRRYIFERFEAIISEFSRTGKVFSVAILDIDFFKKINDEFGHLAGDFILKSFAILISGNLRPYDLFGRYGGEEFIIVSLNSTREQTLGTIRRILDVIRSTGFEFNNNEIRFTFSAGISDSLEYPPNKLTSEMIIDTADKRLYSAKESGRNRIIIVDTAGADEF
ncbi:MAG: PAS domain S-box protein [Candidatus Delongbacteria bacterium]|nr:PAS domain S-box protein [Candidatus Delongbacteria bacterium]